MPGVHAQGDKTGVRRGERRVELCPDQLQLVFEFGSRPGWGSGVFKLGSGFEGDLTPGEGLEAEATLLPGTEGGSCLGRFVDAVQDLRETHPADGRPGPFDDDKGFRLYAETVFLIRLREGQLDDVIYGGGDGADENGFFVVSGQQFDHVLPATNRVSAPVIPRVEPVGACRLKLRRGPSP